MFNLDNNLTKAELIELANEHSDAMPELAEIDNRWPKKRIAKTIASALEAYAARQADLPNEFVEDEPVTAEVVSEPAPAIVADPELPSPIALENDERRGYVRRSGPARPGHMSRG